MVIYSFRCARLESCEPIGYSEVEASLTILICSAGQRLRPFIGPSGIREKKRTRVKAKTAKITPKEEALRVHQLKLLSIVLLLCILRV